MAMNVDKLADEIRLAGGLPPPTTAPNKGMAKAIIDELKTLSVVSFKPGGVTGKAPGSGGKLTTGAASGGKIVGPAGKTLAKKMSKEMMLGGAVTPDLLKMASGITTHYLTGTVTFPVGKITGKCTNSGGSPGALIGEGSGGKIVGLSGPLLAGLCAAAFGGVKSKELVAICTAIVNHIQKNAEVTFTTGAVTGACPSGGGPVTLGAAAKGTVK